MIPAQVATKIIHLASRTLKQYKREMKEQKNPGIGRLKNELRNINKLLKTTPDEESRKTLIQTKNDLINEFLEAIPEEKREIRRLKLKNKEIVDKEERRKANEIVHQMKKALNQENNSENEEKRDKNSLHKKIKKNLKVFRAMWKESHREESEYNVEEELEKLKFQRKQNEERLEDDSEEVEQLYNIMKTVKSMAGPDEKFDPEIEQRYEFMTKMREKRHSRQKKEGNYRPRDEFGEYLYDDPDIRTGVDDVQNVGIEEIDTSPIKNAKEEEERKKKEISKDKFPPEIPQEPIAGQYDGL
ncbi:hypothetical protein TRFO_39870 [Tritrichomonas foetus]|uniref:Uncharacterized protein n=1 Tax=Tritrichomonas foetus TaxID=1144522 RepID=A0A1J4J9M1_9EUKA|nr:hypothetical protein TRFO_39870 [Tritrichomonas foetus]|eukprot:OHS93940.1 hypothetical protein TRFO_39870 [Tritrichomonas foetus]